MSDRYLGTPAMPPARSTPSGGVAGRLAICLWDFSWYTRAGAGEPYEDVDRAMADTAALGYHAVRICAAPLLLAGELGLDEIAAELRIEGLGTAPDGLPYGRGTRWYDVTGGYAIDLRARLHELLDAARRHGMRVILASWEYQQSPAFAADRRWFDAIDAVPLAARHDVLAAAWDRLLSEIRGWGLTDVVAFVELHNEVDFSILPPLAGAGETALALLRARHPGTRVTASFGKPPHLAMHAMPGELDIIQAHVYSYGVLDALQRRIDIRSEGSEGFPNAALRDLLRDDAPTPAAYGRPVAWKLAATVVTDQMVYGYDWIDPERWDSWLDAHYEPHHEVMLREIESRVIAIAAWAHHCGVPAVIGEGWVGYTPLHGRFEEGRRGLELAEHGIRTALAWGVWGVVPCSNAAPHHPMWSDAAWQRRITALVSEA